MRRGGDSGFLVAMAVAFAVGIFLPRLIDHPHPKISGAGTGQPTREPVQESSEVPLRSSPSGARFSQPERSAPSTLGSGVDAARSGLPSALAPAASLAARYAEFSPEEMPTADGLYASTIALWTDESFLALSGAELAEILPTDSYVDASGPKTLQELLGGLPTRADIERALRHPEVQAALERACMLEMDMYGVELIPIEKRTAAWKSACDYAAANWGAAEAELMDDLDRTSGYPHWSILWRLWQRWEK